jgi:hypothetical protein
MVHYIDTVKTPKTHFRCHPNDGNRGEQYSPQGHAVDQIS